MVVGKTHRFSHISSTGAVLKVPYRGRVRKDGTVQQRRKARVPSFQFLFRARVIKALCPLMSGSAADRSKARKLLFGVSTKGISPQEFFRAACQAANVDQDDALLVKINNDVTNLFTQKMERATATNLRQVNASMDSHKLRISRMTCSQRSKDIKKGHFVSAGNGPLLTDADLLNQQKKSSLKAHAKKAVFNIRADVRLRNSGGYNSLSEIVKRNDLAKFQELLDIWIPEIGTEDGNDRRVIEEYARKFAGFKVGE